MDMTLFVPDTESLSSLATVYRRSVFPHVQAYCPAIDPRALGTDSALGMILQRVTGGATISVDYVLVADKTPERLAPLSSFPQDRVIVAEELERAYSEWMRTQYFPRNATVHLYSPEGLMPPAMLTDSVFIEVVGSCQADFFVREINRQRPHLGYQVKAALVTKNHPTERLPVRGERPDCRIVLPPFRYMHPKTMDDFYRITDYDAFFEETVRHVERYLESTVSDEIPHFVVGFIEPVVNPLGIFFQDADLSNVKYFVRALNDHMREWCRTQSQAFFVDGDGLASAVGKVHVDETPVTFVGHRSPLDPFDDWIEGQNPLTPWGVSISFQSRVPEYYVMLLREVLLRLHVLRRREHQVKLVIVDLDNTLWRGRVTDGQLGHFHMRYSGIIEALNILKRRGILLAIASKNDEGFVESHWSEIFETMGPEPSGTTLSLSDFVSVKINFRPKSQNIRDILHETNILPEHTVFIDDNPLEREEVIRAFPTLRVLGSELNYLRRELLYSPYTQKAVLTEEDRFRTESTRSRLALLKHADDGQFLSELHLTVLVSRLQGSDAARMARAFELFNKTNQWNLNGRRMTDAEFRQAVAESRVFVGEVRDAHTNHGLVSVAVAHGHQVTGMVLSCRVIGFQVEHAMFHALFTQLGADGLVLDVSDTGRNKAALDFVSRHAACRDGTWTLPVLELPSHIRLVSPQTVAQVERENHG
ncbi:MAG: HAD-IIIC family phosphatase [Firmicutes bacterium]|nr:HAD-IIIC family phosphatase [Bacillota bacterium]